MVIILAFLNAMIPLGLSVLTSRLIVAVGCAMSFVSDEALAENSVLC